MIGRNANFDEVFLNIFIPEEASLLAKQLCSPAGPILAPGHALLVRLVKPAFLLTLEALIDHRGQNINGGLVQDIVIDEALLRRRRLLEVLEYPAPNDLLHRERWDGGAIGGRGDDVDPVDHPSAYRFGRHIPALLTRHQERVAADPDFAYLRARGEYVKNLRERSRISLSEAARLEEKASDDAWALRLENELLVAKGEEPVASLDELDTREPASPPDPTESDGDALVQATANILIDYIDLSQGIAMADAGTKAAVQ